MGDEEQQIYEFPIKKPVSINIEEIDIERTEICALQQSSMSNQTALMPNTQSNTISAAYSSALSPTATTRITVCSTMSNLSNLSSRSVHIGAQNDDDESIQNVNDVHLENANVATTKNENDAMPLSINANMQIIK